MRKIKKGLLIAGLTLATATTPIIAPMVNSMPVMAAEASSAWTVKFMAGYDDANGKPIELSNQLVRTGANATVPKTPTRTGYSFVRWDKSYNNIKAYTVVTAVWSARTTNVTFREHTRH